MSTFQRFVWVNILQAERPMGALCHHVPAALGALAQHVGADLTVLGIVALALFSALLTDTGTDLCEFGTVIRVPRHEPRVQGRHIGNVPTETGALLHLLAAEAFVGAPFTHFGRFDTVLETLACLIV